MNLKPAILIHLKKNSQRVKGKNLKKINTIPLYEITFRKLFKKNKMLDVYIDSSSEFFEKKAKKFNFKFIKRPKKLNLPNAQGNELIMQCLPKINNEIILQLFVTNPFVKLKTLLKIINKLKKNKKINSVTPVTALYNRFWFNKRYLCSKLLSDF